MSKEDKAPPSPSHGLFDPTTHLLGATSSMGLAGLPFPHLAHLPTYPWLVRPPFPHPLFGGLGGLPSHLMAPGLPHGTTADFAALFNMSKHLSSFSTPSTSASTSSKRSRTPTPVAAHQKSSKTSNASSSACKDYPQSLPLFGIEGLLQEPWHLNGSAFKSKSAAAAHDNSSTSSRKRRHKDTARASSRDAAKIGRSSLFGDVSLALSGRRKEPPPLSLYGEVPSGESGRVERVDEGRVEESGVLNLSKSAPSATVTKPSSPRKLRPPSLPAVIPGVEDLSMKKPSKEPSDSRATNGAAVADSDSANISSHASDADADSDGRVSEPEKNKERSRHMDKSRQEKVAKHIRQQLMSELASPSPQAPAAHSGTPLVIPSLRLRHGKDEEQRPAHSQSPFSLMGFPLEYTRPESLLLERNLLGLPSTSSATHPGALPYLPHELRANHSSRDESQDSLLSFHLSGTDDKGITTDSERHQDSESASGWGSEDEGGTQRDGSSASPSAFSDDSKRRAVVLNERELLIPLEHGWRRQTTIHGMGRRGIVGEVLYFAPCNKKMKTIPDVMRYLDRHGITDLSRENFTFNTKVNVGQFFEIRDKQLVALSELEVLERIALSKGKRARMQMLVRRRNEKALRQQTAAKLLLEQKYRKRQEQQEMARKAAELKFQMRLEKEQQKEMAKKAKEMKLLEKQREKEEHKLAKQQEKIRQQEQLRIERELRAQQMLESNLLWLQMEREREMKKQQQVLEKEQEKERRRQQILLLRALEQKKKEEEKQEKEREREEKLRQKERERERRLAQRQLEMMIARELKKPMDDMELRNVKPLPKFPRCPEAKLPGPAFSDCLMIVEFVHNFADVLGLDSESLPSLEVLQNGLMNSNEEDVEEVVTLYLHLLRFALDDLGVPNPKSAMTALNQKITDLEVTDATMSEITRLFLFAHGEKQMSQWLESIPLEALSATKKAAIIAFLVNELLTSKRLSGEIDKTLETINSLRRDKWIVEGKLRKMRTLRARKFLKLEVITPTPQSSTADDDSCMTTATTTTTTSSKAVSDDEEDKEEGEEEDDDECSESFDDNSTTGNRSEDEDEGLSKEEMDKKIDKLVKQHGSFDSKVADVSKQLRGTCLGQDRYRRFFWILPKTGGVFIEGIESGETDDLPYEAQLLEKQIAENERKAKEEEEFIRTKMENAAQMKKEQSEAMIKKELNAIETKHESPVRESDSQQHCFSDSDKQTAFKHEAGSQMPSEKECENACQVLCDSKEWTDESTVQGCDRHSSQPYSSQTAGQYALGSNDKASKCDNLLSESDVSVSAFKAASLVPQVEVSAESPQDVSATVTSACSPASKAICVRASSTPVTPEEMNSKVNSVLKLYGSPSAWLSDTSSGTSTQSGDDRQKTLVTASTSTSPLSLSFSSPVLSSSAAAPSSSLGGSLTVPSLTSLFSVMTTTTTVVSSFSSQLSLSSSASSTLSSLAAAAATHTGDCKLSIPTVRGSHTTVSTSPVSSPLVSAALSAAKMPESFHSASSVSGLLSPCKSINISDLASKSLLTASLLSPGLFMPTGSVESIVVTTKNSERQSSSPPPTTVISSQGETTSVTGSCFVTPKLSKTQSLNCAAVLSSTPVTAAPFSPNTVHVSATTNNGSKLSSVFLSPVISSHISSLSSPSLSSPAASSANSCTTTLAETLTSSPLTLNSLTSVVKDKKCSFASIDALLKKDDAVMSHASSQLSSSPSPVTATPLSSSSNHFLPPNLFPPSPLVTEHFLKSYIDILEQKPWFSILPRIPCHEFGSLTLPKAATTVQSPSVAASSTASAVGLGMLSSDNIASASLSLLSLLPLQQQQQKEQQCSKVSTATQSRSPLGFERCDSKSSLEVMSAFQEHLDRPSSCGNALAVSMATNTPDSSLCGDDSFKVPAPPLDSFTLAELEIDPTVELSKFQGDRLPIPLSKQRGWWKIRDAQQVRHLFNSLLPRGVREKNMSYTLRKYMDFICKELCDVDTGKMIKLEKPSMSSSCATTTVTTVSIATSTSDPCDDNNPTARDSTDCSQADASSSTMAVAIKTEPLDEDDKSQNVECRRLEVKKEVVDEEEEDDAIPLELEEGWSVRAAYEVELACLEDVEVLEDKILNASLQCKQVWKLAQRASDDPEVEMVDRSVLDPQPPLYYPMELARQRLLLLESNIERRYLKPPLIRNVQLNLVSLGSDRPGSEQKGEGDDSGSQMSESPEDVPPGLMLWRRAVKCAQTPAQLNLCTQLLGNSIAWEKSIMKVTCQICLKDDNEAELLLCDGCDKGYHTYCFKPKMETIPDGDWYCYECVSKVSGRAHCIVCGGGQEGRMVECERCPRAIHIDCLDPPLPRMPKKWQCASCLQTKNKKNSKRKRKDPPPAHCTPAASRERKDSVAAGSRQRKDTETSDSSAAPPEKKKKEAAKDRKDKVPKETKKKEEKNKPEKEKKEIKEKKEKKPPPEKKPLPEKKTPSEKKSPPLDRKTKKKKEEEAALLDPSKDPDLVNCGRLLLELEKSEHGWPFLKPVSSKQFPSYRKYIKQPMDFTTMKNKLRDNTYKTRSEVAADMKLIWSNCEIFNEDDSEVGQAGHKLRTLFLEKWVEVFPGDDLTS